MIIFSSQDIKQAADLLKKGELIAFPTETVYGLGALLSHEEALKKIYIAKGRPSDNPLIVHLADLQDVTELAIDIPDIFWILAKTFSPGPLTFILKKAPHVSSTISAGLSTIALRFPSHPIAKKLIREAGDPIAAPSANLSGKPSGTHISHILEDLEGRIAGVIEAEGCFIGLESTVINLTVTPPVILRPGSITKEDLEAVLSKPVLDKVEGEAIVSPGMKYRHYAPQALVKLFTHKEEFLSYLSIKKTNKTAILARLNQNYAHFFPLTGKTLYATLRLIDTLYFDEIAIFCDADVQKNAALMNRLKHASQS